MTLDIEKARRELAVLYSWWFANAPVKDRMLEAERRLIALLNTQGDKP